LEYQSAGSFKAKVPVDQFGARLPVFQGANYQTRGMVLAPYSQYRRNEGELMTQERIQEYRRALESRVVELSSIRHRTEEIAIERVPDSMDNVVLAGERELVMEAIHRDSLFSGAA
jgi:hypothetical protein